MLKLINEAKKSNKDLVIELRALNPTLDKFRDASIDNIIQIYSKDMGIRPEEAVAEDVSDWFDLCGSIGDFIFTYFNDGLSAWTLSDIGLYDPKFVDTINRAARRLQLVDKDGNIIMPSDPEEKLGKHKATFEELTRWMFTDMNKKADREYKGVSYEDAEAATDMNALNDVNYYWPETVDKNDRAFMMKYLANIYNESLNEDLITYDEDEIDYDEDEILFHVLTVTDDYELIVDSYYDDTEADAAIEEMNQMTDDELLYHGILAYAQLEPTGDVRDMYISGLADYDKAKAVLDQEISINESKEDISEVEIEEKTEIPETDATIVEPIAVEEVKNEIEEVVDSKEAELEVLDRKNGLKEMTKGVTNQVWDIISNINSVIATIKYDFKEDEVEDIIKIFNELIDDLTIDLGMLSKISNILDSRTVELMDKGEEKAEEILKN